jgi:2-amino-4-hydroxy-6-hydroxymethyldihydropteridine diphosphokinase
LTVADAFVGIGSNVDPERHVRRALRLLGASGRLVGISTIYRTPSVGLRSQPDFFNGVVELETGLSPAALERELKEVERRLGRVRTEDKWAPRTIDLDLLLHEGADLSRAPVRPGPELRERAFVAIPLAELAPDLVLPDGARAIEAAALARPWPMEPLRDFTELLREDARNG